MMMFLESWPKLLEGGETNQQTSKICAHDIRGRKKIRGENMGGQKYLGGEKNSVIIVTKSVII